MSEPFEWRFWCISLITYHFIMYHVVSDVLSNNPFYYCYHFIEGTTTTTKALKMLCCFEFPSSLRVTWQLLSLCSIHHTWLEPKSTFILCIFDKYLRMYKFHRLTAMTTTTMQKNYNKSKICDALSAKCICENIFMLICCFWCCWCDKQQRDTELRGERKHDW